MTDHTGDGGVLVTLSPAAVEQAERMGRGWLRIAAGRNRFNPTRGDDDVRRRVESAGARLALARWYGGTIPADLRWTYTPNDNGALVVGSDEGRWVLIRGRMPNYTIVGWCHGHEREERGTFRGDVVRPGWFVRRLRALDELREGSGR